MANILAPLNSANTALNTRYAGTPSTKLTIPAQSTGPATGGVNSAYSYVRNGSGGVNYFRNGKPITNAEYRKATGQDTNAIEARVAQEFQQAPAASFANDSVAFADPAAARAAAEDAKNAALVRDRLGMVNSKLDNYKSLFGALYGNIDAAAQDQVNTLRKTYGGQRTSLTDEYNANTPAIDMSYYLSGVGDSSLRLGQQGKAENTFKSGLSSIDTNEQNDLSTIGQTVATKKAGYQADENNIENIRQSAGLSTDPGELLSLANSIDTKSGALSADAVGFQTGGAYRAALQKAAPGVDLTPIQGTLKSLINGAASSAVKNQVGSNLINSSGATDEQKKSLFQQYLSGV